MLLHFSLRRGRLENAQAAYIFEHYSYPTHVFLKHNMLSHNSGCNPFLDWSAYMFS